MRKNLLGELLAENFTSGSLGGVGNVLVTGSAPVFHPADVLREGQTGAAVRFVAGVFVGEAIDRLLSAAHMAYLVVVMMVELAKRGRMAQTRGLLRLAL